MIYVIDFACCIFEINGEFLELYDCLVWEFEETLEGNILEFEPDCCDFYCYRKFSYLKFGYLSAGSLFLFYRFYLDCLSPNLSLDSLEVNF